MNALLKKSTTQVMTLLLLLAPFNIAWTQTGAAGVGSSLSNVIWLDANSLGLGNGTPVSSFTDYSGNNNHFTQASSSLRPIFSTNAINGLPALNFDGTDDVLKSGSIPALESSSITFFIVFEKSPLKFQNYIGSNYSSESNKWSSYSPYNNDRVTCNHKSPTINGVNYVDANVFTFTSGHITPTVTSIYNQGNLMSSKNLTYTTPTGHNYTTIGNIHYTASQNWALDGYIAEVVVYNSSMNSLERIMIENYLGAKYNMSIPTDLFAYEGTHNIGLVGIGNDGTNSQTAALGKGIMEIGNASGMSSGEYLLAAHTNVTLADFTTSDLPASLPTHQRFTRTWRVDETGDVGILDVVFHLSGNNFGSSSSYRLLVDNDGDFSNSTIYTGTYDGGAQTITFSVDLNDGEYFTLAGIEQSLVINSIASGNWSDPGTWDCTCIPGMNDDVFINPFNTVTLDVDGSCNYLDIEPNGALICNNSSNLDIYTDWDIIGDVTFNDGSFSMVGEVDQYVDAGGGSVIFNDIYINNSAAGTITFYEATYLLNGTLYPQQGHIVMDGGAANQFIVNSTSPTTGGRIAALENGFTITGDISVRRFLQSGNADWRNLCSPVVGSTFDDWDPDLAMSGPGFPDGCAIDSVGNCFKSVQYHENGYYYPVLNSTDNIQNGRGYQIWVGDDLSVFSGTTLTSRGSVNSSNDFVKSVNTGWWIIGNPYVSPITFNSVQKLSPVGKYFYIYDAASGSYQWYDEISGTSSVPEITSDGLISIGQGFWVKVNSATNIVFDQSDKSDATATYIRGTENDNSIYIKIKENNSTYFNVMSIEEKHGALDESDTLFDIFQLATGFEKCPLISIYSQEDNIQKNYIKPDGISKSFDLNIKIQNEGYHTIEAENIHNFNSYSKVMLYDNETGDMVNLKNEPNYVFYSEPTEGNRFTLILTNEETAENNLGQTAGIEEESGDITITQMGTVVDVNCPTGIDGEVAISLVNVLGQKEVYSVSTQFVQGSNIIELPADLKGVHLLVIETNTGIITKKLVF